MSQFFDQKPIWKRTIEAQDISLDLGLRGYMVSVYAYMAGGLGLTGLVAFFLTTSETLMRAIFLSPLQWLVMFAPVGIVFFLTSRIAHLSLQTAQTLFWIYAGLMGLSLSSIFLIFTGESIARLFFIAASTFGAMSLYGYTTRKDLTALGSFLIMGVFGIVIASIVNLFLHSTSLQSMLSVIGVLVFTGLTAYDTQRVKESYYEGDARDVSQKKAIFGALQLYLDFVNLFIMLLHLFGERRDER